MSFKKKTKPQMKASRVAPLEGASTYAPAGAYVLCIAAGMTPMNADLLFW